MIFGLKKAAFIAYPIRMLNDILKETARQRATRIWRNHQLRHLYKPSSPQESYPEIIRSNKSEPSIDQLQARFRKEMRTIITTQKNKPLLNYLKLKLARKRIIEENKHE